VLTSLEPPSPASSAGPREVERSLQTTLQLPEALPMTSPPEPVKHHDTGESSRVTPVSKRWFRAIFKKIIKNQASQPPEQLSTKSGHPVKLGFDSQSQPTASIAQNRSSRYAAGKRQAVSVFFFGRQQVCGVSDEVSQRSVAKPVNWVRCSVYSLAPLFILCGRVRKIPRLLNRAIRSRTRPVVDKGLQVQRKWVPCISFHSMS
jgi:hypothetical protein